MGVGFADSVRVSRPPASSDSAENTNGLIPEYLSKRTSQEHVTQADCDRIAAKLNSRSRKRSGCETPEECYAAIS